MLNTTPDTPETPASGADTPDTQVIVELAGVTKAFGDNRILRGIDLVLNRGENLVVMGKSGTGKSVLIKCIAGLLDIDDGRISLDSKPLDGIGEAELAELRGKLGYLFQSGALYDSMTARGNLEFPLRRRMRKITDEEIGSKVAEALKNVGLDIATDRMPSELSGGMRKRLGLARALILQPAIMLYDEPTTGLDPITSREISSLILDVQKEYHTSSIIVTHDLDCARRTGNRIIVLKEGVCAAEGTYEELENSPDEWIRSFFE
jgi:phospholipid/cholesterol/gamma-HCH transport system ATP-binding protein